ncbi:MAG: radical SAM protein [Candidatus Woesearchaeota archaeon]
MKIMLVYSGTDHGFQNFMAVPPVGIIALYSALPQEHREKTVFLDGNLIQTTDIEEIIIDERPDIVGISSLTFGYENAINIGKTAKIAGAKVVLGGRHATDLCQNIYVKMKHGLRPFDYLVYGEGEERFLNIVQDLFETGNVQRCPNVFPKDGSFSPSIITEQTTGFDRVFPVLDYSLLTGGSSLKEYVKRIGRIGILNDANFSMPIITQRGCHYSYQRQCKFCSIPRVNPKIPYEVFENSLQNLLEQTGADNVWITDADLTVNVSHLKEIRRRVKRVKERISVDFSIYAFARSDDVLREGVADLLVDTGVRAVFIGYEHGSNSLLRKMGKRTTKQQNLQATKILAEKGIEVICGGIVLGTPGETLETLDQALGFAEELADTGNVRSIFASPVYPLPSAPYWKEFLDVLKIADPFYYERILEEDILDEEDLVERFQKVIHLMKGGVRESDKPSLEQIMRIKEEISKIIGKGIQFTDRF